MKFPQGTQGKGVMFAESIESASSMLDALSTLKQPVLIQEYIDTDGVDVRVIVIGDEVVAAMKRVATSGEKRANVVKSYMIEMGINESRMIVNSYGEDSPVDCGTSEEELIKNRRVRFSLTDWY